MKFSSHKIVDNTELNRIYAQQQQVYLRTYFKQVGAFVFSIIKACSEVIAVTWT